MRINTNVSAMIAANNLSRVQNALSGSMEKLSSGFRINKAADDAAGLGIANTLRADGRALSQASRNADQTNSLLQVADGGTSTIESILERMKELATQAGSDTVDAAGRTSINAEFTALRSEIDRTVKTTKFEGSSLLDGTFGSARPQLTAADVTVAGGHNSTAVAGDYSLSVSDAGIATLKSPAGATPASYTVDLNNAGSAVSYAGGKASITFGSGNSAITVAGTSKSATDALGLKQALDGHGFTLTAAVAADASSSASTVAGATAVTVPVSQAAGTLHFQVSDAAATAASGLTASSLISGTTVGANQAAGAYTMHVVSTDAAASGGTLSGSTGVGSIAVGASQAAGTYTIAVTAQNASLDAGNGVDAILGGGTSLAVNTNAAAGAYTLSASGNTLKVMHGANQVGADVDLSTFDFSTDLAVNEGGISFTVTGGTYANATAFDAAADATSFNVTGSASLTVSDGSGPVGSPIDLSSYDGSADISVNQGGISFTIDHAADADIAAISTAVNGKTVAVTAAAHTLTLKDSGNATVGAAQDFSAFDGAADIAFSQGGISFTIDKSTTMSTIAGALDSKVLTVTGPKVDLLDSTNAVLATQDLSSYTAGSSVAFSNAGYGITFDGANIATDTYAHLKATLNDANSTITATRITAADASAGTITGNVASAASFLIDSSGAYKTSDVLELNALDLNVSTLGLTDSDLLTADGAREALSTIDGAIGMVSSALGTIGANQNRISYAQNNLKIKIVNFAAAESVIRDVDIADEMTSFSKNSILAQAGTAMLAQANHSGQSVLQLLQG